MTTTDIRDQLAAALHALHVAAVPDPDLDTYASTVLLAGGTAFRLADLTAEGVEADDIESHEVRARFSQGWNNIRDAAGCGTSGEAAILAVFTDLIGSAARDNAAKGHNPYAKAASFAMEAAAALLYLSTDYDATNPAEAPTRAAAAITADDRLTHAHAWLAHTGSTS